MTGITRRTLLKGATLAFLQPKRTTQPVLMDHDGGTPDDYLATALLLSMDHVRPLGIVITEADCFIQPALSATCKLLGMMGKTQVPVAASTVKGRNPFPTEWRKTAYDLDRTLSVANPPSPLRETGQSFMVKTLRDAAGPVTLLVTGPLSSVAAALDADPKIESKIKSIAWMGGALNVKGNVEEKGHDGSAEWNVYWDPPAAARVWRTRIPIVLCPLDITNHAPVTQEIVDRLKAESRHPLAAFAAKALAPTRMSETPPLLLGSL